ncbi:MAG: plasmid segregation actin-type ATPase ParM, partial [Oscillospiraceae bacterium]|nr:plasmid segregation actin-type ATPase ParM [Oscillospiraceae bacterium]
IDSEYAEVLRQAISEYADNIFALLRKYEYNPKLMRLYITGGGGRLIEHFGTYEHDRVTIIGDICASAKGYEDFAAAQLRKEGR